MDFLSALCLVIRTPETSVRWNLCRRLSHVISKTILDFNQKLNDADRKQVKIWTQYMINVIIGFGGTYYLTYQR
ncbi:unnamed protein product [Adineta ricciae]|uniref:Uncharacterized protein n=1 Tax=Adineta ricciae TaxID=249248 RepID=A0A815ARI8_ADIRI|nr:unnamed protein product [Adineta ricciae]